MKNNKAESEKEDAFAEAFRKAILSDPEMNAAFRASQNNMARLSKLTNSELADELIDGPWANTRLFEEFSDLLEEVINRLMGRDGKHVGK